MAITVADIITPLNTYISDSSNDRITQAERLNFITEATLWYQEETENEFSNETYSFNYFDTVNRYKLTNLVTDVINTCDLLPDLADHTEPFTKIDPDEIKLDIGNGNLSNTFSLERKSGDWYLWVNYQSKYPKKQISSFESLTADGGTWAVDSTNSDATNLTVDDNSFTEGQASLNFDVSVSQSGNNRATIQNTGLTELDLSDYDNLGSFLVDIDFPVVTHLSSVTFYWGSSQSDYYSVTATTDIDGSSFVVGTNTLKFNWSSATTTGSPSASAIDFIRFDINYTASQANATDYRIDNLRLVRPVELEFIYTSFNVGTNSSGTAIKAFGATTDIPYVSGQYDGARYPIAHKAASLAFRSLRLYAESAREEEEAIKALARIEKIVPSSVKRSTQSFKVAGINFRKRK